jgi:hypothetical protein
MSNNIETVEIQGESSVDWQSTAMQYIELNKQKTEAIQRVRELHKLVTENNAACGNPDCCGEYEEWEMCADCWSDYPCPTIKALDGEQS